MFNSLYKKCLNLSAHKNSKNFLAFISFIESSFFPIPPDALLIPMIIAAPRKAWILASLTILCSVAGGLFGYLIAVSYTHLTLPTICSV